MPYVNMKISDDGVSVEQKLKLIKGVTDLLQEVLGKDPKSTFVVIDEVNCDNWGLSGVSLTELRKKVK